MEDMEEMPEKSVWKVRLEIDHPENGTGKNRGRFSRFASFFRSESESGEESGAEEKSPKNKNSVRLPLILMFISLFFLSVAMIIWALNARTNSDVGLGCAVDETFDPCQKFYEYACGNRNEKEEFPSRGKIRQNYYLNIQEILTGNWSGNESEEKARHFFQSCVNQSQSQSENGNETVSSQNLANLKEIFESDESAQKILQEAETFSDDVSLVCSRLTQHYFLPTISSLLLQKLEEGSDFELESIKMAEEISQNVKGQFVSMLQVSNSTWLSQNVEKEEKPRIIERANFTTIAIGYYNSSTNVTDDLKYDRNSSFEVNVQNLAQGKSGQRGISMEESFLGVFSNQSNTLYLSIPPEVLNAPLFHSKGSEGVNYGSFGVVVGHLLFHHFLGNQAENNKGLESCLNSTAEIMAERGGLELAFGALLSQFHGEKDENDKEKRRFFLSFAQSWRSHKNGENNQNARIEHEDDWNSTVVMETKADFKSNSLLRVNEVLQNFPGFLDTFKCAGNSNETIEENCSVF